MVANSRNKLRAPVTLETVAPATPLESALRTVSLETAGLQALEAMLRTDRKSVV